MKLERKESAMLNDLQKPKRIKKFWVMSKKNSLKSTYNYTHGSIMDWELAYEVAKKSDRNYPSSWDENEMAGEDWIDGFLKPLRLPV